MASVLSIQSAVTIGAVGNTMAGIVMAGRGHHLCRVDTVQLAAHPGYGFRAGGSISDDDFASLLEGLDRLNTPFEALMTGYIGRVGQLTPLADFITRIAARSPDMPVIVDPAIGDNGRLYVDPLIAGGISTALLPLGHVITPNSFELGWLTGQTITTRDDAIASARLLLGRHPCLQAVVVTGLAEGGGVSDGLITREGGRFFEKHGDALPWDTLPGGGLPGGLPGGGDMFTALMVAAMVSGRGLEAAVAEASRMSHAIIGQSRAEGADEILLPILCQHLEP